MLAKWIRGMRMRLDWKLRMAWFYGSKWIGQTYIVRKSAWVDNWNVGFGGSVHLSQDLLRKSLWNSIWWISIEFLISFERDSIKLTGRDRLQFRLF